MQTLHETLKQSEKHIQCYNILSTISGLCSFLASLCRFINPWRYAKEREKKKKASLTKIIVRERNWLAQGTGNKRWNLWNLCHHLKTGSDLHWPIAIIVTGWDFGTPPCNGIGLLIQLRADVHNKQLKTQTLSVTQLEEMWKENLICDMEEIVPSLEIGN